jgi:hypothetical protein
MVFAKYSLTRKQEAPGLVTCLFGASRAPCPFGDIEAQIQGIKMFPPGDQFAGWQ